MNAAREDITADHCSGCVRHSRRLLTRCVAMENIRCDVDQNLWPDQQERQDVHQQFFSWMLFSIFVYLW